MRLILSIETLKRFPFEPFTQYHSLSGGNGLLNLSESELIVLLGRNVGANFANGGGGSLGQQQGVSEDIIASLPTRIISNPTTSSLNSKEEGLQEEEVVRELEVEVEEGSVAGQEVSSKAAASAPLATDLDLPSSSSATTPTNDSISCSSTSASSSTSCSVDTCPICMDAMAPGHVAKNLPCLHAFHANCVDKWLRMSRRCPMCNHCVSDE